MKAQVVLANETLKESLDKLKNAKTVPYRFARFRCLRNNAERGTMYVPSF
jgi:hypothetical protein